MVDITSTFRACLLEATLSSRNGSVGKAPRSKGNKRHAFSVRAEDILADIKRVESFLTEEDVMGLSSEETDDIETGALSILRTTKLLIGKYKKDLESGPKLSSQVVSHFLGVAEILERKLRVVEQVFIRQRECRIEGMKIKREMKVDNFIHEEEDEEDELSPEELQLFQRENASMFEELQRTQNEVVKIAELQELFSEKILQQKDDIELVSQNALAASENIKDGNEELRKAIQNKASIRVYILFSLLVLSFSLLFLDWYNP
ncbi:Syntaxin-18 [Caligus rogercresseyi]|uniref:Syntaxin-18 n=1 Tax=Caligus rogercresseyi TaxID=217165 RepID=A0A7T8K989_CALRO|nr:Syntaxin-18 [Caligus rogercresseyi]